MVSATKSVPKHLRCYCGVYAGNKRLGDCNEPAVYLGAHHMSMCRKHRHQRWTWDREQDKTRQLVLAADVRFLQVIWRQVPGFFGEVRVETCPTCGGTGHVILES